MRILVISDSHGRNTYLDKVVDRVTNIDLLIHLGDFEGGENHIREVALCKVEMVSGNNDYFTSMDREKVISIGKYKVLLTHGHRYNVNTSRERIREIGIEQKVDIVMFGHTHMPIVDKTSKPILINPGSITQPRQEGRIPSYILMEIDKEGEAHFTINYMK